MVRLYFTPEQVEQFWPGADPAEINAQANNLLAPIALERDQRIIDLLTKEVSQNEHCRATMATVTLAYLRPVLRLANEALEMKSGRI